MKGMPTTLEPPLVVMSTDRKMCAEMHLDDFPPIACLYRCQPCSVWWARGQIPETGKEHLLFSVVEPYGDLLRWEDFHGWHYRSEEAHLCPLCGESAGDPAFALFETKNITMT